MANSMRDLCTAPSGQAEVLQGNIAFAAGCVRGGSTPQTVTRGRPARR
jgi:hypothetical protein